MQDNGPTIHRFVCVLNKKIGVGRAMNALGHLTTALVGKIEDKDLLRFQDYTDADGNIHPNISDNPFVVLKARNSGKLRTLREVLIQKDIPFVDFTHTMIEGTYMDQLKQTEETKEKDMEYYGVCFFARHEVSKELTKKFSLYN